MNNDFNQMGSIPNQNMNYGQPMNNQPMPGPAPMPGPQPMGQPMPGPQPMPGQPMNNGQGYGYNYQAPKKFTFPAIAKDTPSIIGYISAFVMMVGSFLDFATVNVSVEGYESLSSSATVNYFITNGQLKDGIIVFILAIAVLALVHFRKNLFALIPAGLAGAVLIADIAGVDKIVAEYEQTSYWFDYIVDVSYGPAVFVIALGIVGVIVHAVMYHMNKNKPQQMAQPMMNGMPNQQPMMNGMMNQPMGQPMNQPMPGPQPMPGQPMNYNQNNQYPNNNMMM